MERGMESHQQCWDQVKDAGLRGGTNDNFPTGETEACRADSSTPYAEQITKDGRKEEALDKLLLGMS